VDSHPLGATGDDGALSRSAELEIGVPSPQVPPSSFSNFVALLPAAFGRAIHQVVSQTIAFILTTGRGSLGDGRTRGVCKGWPAKIDIREIAALKAERLGASQITTKLGVGRAYVYWLPPRADLA
jgi:hypothetical protein